MLKHRLYRLFFFIFVFNACTQSEHNSQSPSTPHKNPDVLNVALGAEPDTLDWQMAKTVSAGLLNINLMRGLFRVKTTGKKLATELDLVLSASSKNKKDWTLCLKPNIAWSDGHPLEAQHFVDAWQRLLSPETGSPNAHQLFIVKGAEEFQKGKIPFNKVGIKINKDQCLQLQLHKPYQDLPLLMSAPYTFPIRKDLLTRHGNNLFLPKNYVNLGDYTLASEQTPGMTTLQWRHPKMPKSLFSSIHIHWLNHGKVAVDLFKKGEMDVVLSPPQDSLTENLKQSLNETPTASLYFLMFNLKQPRMQNPLTRHFIDSGVDPLALSKALGPSYDVAESIVPWHFYGESFRLNRKPKEFSAEFIQQQQKLFKDKPLILLTNGNLFNRTVMENIQFQLKQKLKIPVEIKISGSGNYLQHIKQHQDHGLFRLSWTPALATPEGFLELFDPNSKTGFLTSKMESLEKRFSQLRNETASSKKMALIHDIEKQLVTDEHIVIPLLWQNQTFLINKDKVQFTPHFSSRIYFDTIRWVPGTF